MSELEIPSAFSRLSADGVCSGCCRPSAHPATETWLADSGIACSVSAPWNGKGYVVAFANQADAALFRMCWL